MNTGMAAAILREYLDLTFPLALEYLQWSIVLMR